MKIAIIPARAGSKRLKKKNIMSFCGKPMISYALSVANESGLFDKIHVSTDSEQIKAISENLGYPVDFLRPESLADDMSGLMPVMRWVLEKYASQGFQFDDIFCLMPTAILIDPDDLKRAFDVYNNHDRNSPLLMVAPFPAPLEWAYRRDQEGLLIPEQPGKFAIRSQDLKKAFYESGPFTIFNKKHILSDNPIGDEGFISCILPPNKSVDIDYPEDVELAETLFLGNLVMKSPKFKKLLIEENVRKS